MKLVIGMFNSSSWRPVEIHVHGPAHHTKWNQRIIAITTICHDFHSNPLSQSPREAGEQPSTDWGWQTNVETPDPALGA